MGILVCSRCKAKTTDNSIEEGRKRLDHVIGLYINKPFEDGRAELFFTETKPTKTIKIDKHKAKSKKD